MQTLLHCEDIMLQPVSPGFHWYPNLVSSLSVFVRFERPLEVKVSAAWPMPTFFGRRETGNLYHVLPLASFV